MNRNDSPTIKEAYLKLVDKYGAKNAPVAFLRRLKSVNAGRAALGIDLVRRDENGDVYDDWSVDLIDIVERHIITRELDRYNREVVGYDLYESDDDLVESLHKGLLETIGAMSTLWSVANEPTADF